MELIEKLFGKRFQKEFPFNGKKLVMQYLTKEEQLETFIRGKGGDLIYQVESVKVPTIARSIVSIDGSTWDEDDEVKALSKEAENKDLPIVAVVEKVILKRDPEIINALYELYLQLMDERKKEVERLKKV